VGRASLLKAWEDACGDADERRKKDSGEGCKSAHSIHQGCESVNTLEKQDKP
jgi:hypothetical protein